MIAKVDETASLLRKFHQINRLRIQTKSGLSQATIANMLKNIRERLQQKGVLNEEQKCRSDG